MAQRQTSTPALTPKPAVPKPSHTNMQEVRGKPPLLLQQENSLSNIQDGRTDPSISNTRARRSKTVSYEHAGGSNGAW
jgi:hypothetical protein